jgi:hypothetical protein
MKETFAGRQIDSINEFAKHFSSMFFNLHSFAKVEFHSDDPKRMIFQERQLIQDDKWIIAQHQKNIIDRFVFTVMLTQISFEPMAAL